MLADTVLQTPEAELVTTCTDLEVLDQSDQPPVTTEHTAAGVAMVVAHDEVTG